MTIEEETSSTHDHQQYLRCWCRLVFVYEHAALDRDGRCGCADSTNNCCQHYEPTTALPAHGL
eukprot:30316-Eustigmatos_ZCMA.PRE.1